jgi:hypothetical protein
MKTESQGVKERGKAVEAVKPQVDAKADDLEPCTAPQAAEAQRAAAMDEACDDGVN